MRTLEIRRHSFTKKGVDRGHGSHLSAEGVAIARSIGEEIGPFAFVGVSPVPRTMETALAMGVAVDEVIDFAGDLWDAAQAEFGHRTVRDDPALYSRYVELLQRDGPTAALARRQVEIWTSVVERIPDSSSALLISHGGLIEPGLIAALPDWPRELFGRGFRHCEGVRLRRSDGEWTDGEGLLRDNLQRPL